MLYAVVRFFAAPLLRVWFRPKMTGTGHIPREGAAILVTNHKSFLDGFFVGLATRRHVHFMIKAEAFRGPLGKVLLRLGAFPVRRGSGDTEAYTTSLAILRDGGLLVLFPEGTRVDDADALARPHHGAQRLAEETGAPIVAGAIAGTQRLWLGPIPKPRRVRLTFLPPIEPPADLDDQVWPAVVEEYGRLRAASGLIAAAVAATGVGAGLVARHQRRRSAPVRVLDKLGPKRLRKRRGRH